MAKWQAGWDNTDNKDGLNIETTKAIAGRLAAGDFNDIGKSIADLKTRQAVNTLITLLDYPNDLILKEVAGTLASFPTKEVAMALFTKLKELDSALAGGTHGIVAQEQAISAAAKSLFGITKIEATPDFADHEKRNQAIESALERMVPEKEG